MQLEARLAWPKARTTKDRTLRACTPARVDAARRSEARKKRLAVGSPGLILGNKDEEGGKVVQMALSDGEGDDRSGVLTWVQEAMVSVVLGDEENRGRRREGES
jgi:hypothetical protein